MNAKTQTASWPPKWLTPVAPEAIANGDGWRAADFAELFGSIGKDGIAGRMGEPLVLRDWQRELLAHLYARDANGGLVAQTALLGLPRKNGKSALSSAAIGLYSLIAEGINGGEVICVASEKEQARIVFGEAKRMVEATELRDLVTLYKDSIYVPGTGSVLKVVSAEAYSKEGLNPSRVIMDELHAHQNRELFDVFSLAMGNRGKIGQLVAITTAGVKTDTTGQDSIAYSLYQYGQKVARKEIIDPAFFMAWWQAEDNADHRSREAWIQANPGFADIISEEDFESAVRRTPEAEFRTKRLNQWVSSQNTWLPAGAWESCKAEIEFPDDVDYVLGFDGSYSGDSTAIVAVTIEEIPRVFLVATWEKDFANDDDSWRVPIQDVEQTLLTFVAEHPQVREVVCDPFRWSRSMEVLQEAGLPIVAFPNTVSRMVPATALVFDAVVAGQLQHDGNPAMARHIENCVLKIDARGPRITKESNNSKRKIDNAVAFVMAFSRARVGKLETEQGVPEFFSF